MQLWYNLFLCVNFYGSVVREITHAKAQSMHEYVWRVKWDQGERNGRLGSSNWHPPDRESCLMSGLPTRWHACKLPHCRCDILVLFTNPSARAGYDTRSIFKRSLTGFWIQSFPSPRLVASPRLKNLVRPTIYP